MPTASEIIKAQSQVTEARKHEDRLDAALTDSSPDWDFAACLDAGDARQAIENGLIAATLTFIKQAQPTKWAANREALEGLETRWQVNPGVRNALLELAMKFDPTAR